MNKTKVTILLLALAIYPASAYAFAPLIPIVLAFAGSSVVASMFQVYAIKQLWPLAVALLSFYAYFVYIQSLTKKAGIEMSGIAAKRLDYLAFGAHVILIVGLVSITYYLGGFEVMAEYLNEVKE